MSEQLPILKEEFIAPNIYNMRGEKVILDRDLAALYGIETKRLKEAVRRNIERFPVDFMFELTNDEFQNWRTQFASSNSEKMGLRYSPMAFTEQGIAMISSVIHTPRAIEVNIAIMRIFVKLRRLVLQNAELSERLFDLEESMLDKLSDHDDKFDIIFDAISQLTESRSEPRRPIGFYEPIEEYKSLKKNTNNE